MIKEWIIKLFKINTYEEEYKKYEELYQDSLTRGEVIKSVAQNYKRELDNLLDIFDDLLKTSEDILATANDPDRKRECYEHRAYASGRQDAYAEMGIIEELDEEFFKKFCEEIEIDDLVEGTSDEDLDTE